MIEEAILRAEDSFRTTLKSEVTAPPKPRSSTMSNTLNFRICREVSKMLANFFWGITMKSLVLLAMSVVATSAMAAGPSGVQTIIAGQSTQAVVLLSSVVRNTANGHNSNAQQNLASNAGDVDITSSGKSTQIVGAYNTTFSNTSNAHTKAQQNVSSNSGDVTISGNSLQLTLAANSAVSNTATGHNAKAVQSIASNSSCSTCL